MMSNEEKEATDELAALSLETQKINAMLYTIDATSKELAALRLTDQDDDDRAKKIKPAGIDDSDGGGDGGWVGDDGYYYGVRPGCKVPGPEKDYYDAMLQVCDRMSRELKRLVLPVDADAHRQLTTWMRDLLEIHHRDRRTYGWGSGGRFKVDGLSFCAMEGFNRITRAFESLLTQLVRADRRASSVTVSPFPVSPPGAVLCGKKHEGRREIS